jgi:hypothetical protein
LVGFIVGIIGRFTQRLRQANAPRANLKTTCFPKQFKHFRSTSEMINVSVDMVRGLTWGEVRDLLRFARRRLREEKAAPGGGSLTFTTTLALVPLLTIVLAIFTTFPIFGQLRTALELFRADALMPKAIANTIILEPDPVRQQGHGPVGGGRGGAAVHDDGDDGHDRARLQPDLARQAPAPAGAAHADLLGPGDARAAAVRPVARR